MKPIKLALLSLAAISSTTFADTSIIAQHEQSTGRDSYVGIKIEAPLSDSDKAVSKMFSTDKTSRTTVQVYGVIDLGYQYSK
ncbi:MAG: hypothetical protein WAU37_07325 [Formosimonas sp.]|jgi:hypothetical protein